MGNFTTEELYEQAKRSLRQMCLTYDIVKPGGPAFILACKQCGLPFRDDIEVGMVGEHASIEHNIDFDKEKVTLDLIWIGDGPPPEAQN